MISKSIYEIVPYAYFISGASILQFPVVADSWIGITFAMLLMARGATIWVMRSYNRRSDGYKNKSLGAIPFWLYELLPFVYAIGAISIFSLAENTYLYPSAAIFLVVFIQLYFMRTLYRKHQRPDVRFPRRGLS